MPPYHNRSKMATSHKCLHISSKSVPCSLTQMVHGVTPPPHHGHVVTYPSLNPELHLQLACSISREPAVTSAFRNPFCKDSEGPVPVGSLLTTRDISGSSLTICTRLQAHRSRHIRAPPSALSWRGRPRRRAWLPRGSWAARRCCRSRGRAGSPASASRPRTCWDKMKSR